MRSGRRRPDGKTDSVKRKKRCMAGNGRCRQRFFDWEKYGLLYHVFTDKLQDCDFTDERFMLILKK